MVTCGFRHRGSTSGTSYTGGENAIGGLVSQTMQKGTLLERQVHVDGASKLSDACQVGSLLNA